MSYQKGFTPILLILIFVVLSGGIVGGAYLISKNPQARQTLHLNNNEDQETNNIVPAQNSTTNQITSEATKQRAIPFSNHQLELTDITESLITLEENTLSGTNSKFKTSKFFIEGKVKISFSGKYAVNSPQLDYMNGGVELDGKPALIVDFVPKEYSIKFNFSDNSCPSPGTEQKFFGDNMAKPLTLKFELGEMPSSSKQESLNKYAAEYQTKRSYEKTDFYQHCEDYNKAYFDSISLK